MNYLAPIGASAIFAASFLEPLAAGSTALATSETGLLQPDPSYYQVTTFDAAAALRPRQLVAKTELAGLEPGMSPDASGRELIFFLKVGEEWRTLGSAVTDRHAVARLPFPRDLELPPGLYELSVTGRDDSCQPGSGRLLITGDRPTLLIDVDGPVLDDSRHTWGRFFRRNILHQHFDVTAGAHDTLWELSRHYRLVYLAPLRNEGGITRIRTDLFREGLLPHGPVFTNDFGLRLKPHSRTVSLERLEEFVDNAIAELRGFDGVPLVGAIALDDRDHPHVAAMKRHGLETMTVPDSEIRFWQFWKWITFRKRRQDAQTTRAWGAIRNSFVGAKDDLAGRARALIGQRYHPDPQVRFQTELDLVTGAKLYFRNGVTLYTDGAQAFEAVKALLQGAKSVFPEFPDLANASHRRVAALKIRGDDGELRDIAILGGRKWYDNTVIVEGPVVHPIVENLERVAGMTGSPLRPEQSAAFAVTPRPHPDDLPARYVVHYPKEDLNIQRTFVSMLNNPASPGFFMESPFPLTSELMREMISAKQARPEREITWITGTFSTDRYSTDDALRDAQALILRRHGIRVVVRTPLNESKLSPMHVRRFSDGLSFFVGSWNPDDPSNKDLESGILFSPNPENSEANAKIDEMIYDIQLDAMLGIDIDSWLEMALPEVTSNAEERFRRLLLRIAPKLQHSLNYFL